MLFNELSNYRWSGEHHPRVMSHHISSFQIQKKYLTFLFSSTLLEELPTQSTESIGILQKDFRNNPKNC